MKTLEDIDFQSGRQRWFPKKGKRKCCWFHEDTRGGRRWFPKWETRLVQRVGGTVSKTISIFKIFFFLNENKEEWYRRESKRGNFILKDNYGS